MMAMLWQGRLLTANPTTERWLGSRSRQKACNSSNDGQKSGNWFICKDLSIRNLVELAENAPKGMKRGMGSKKEKTRFIRGLKFIQTNRNQEPNKAKLTTSEGVVGITSGCLLQHLTRVAAIATEEGS